LRLVANSQCVCCLIVNCISLFHEVIGIYNTSFVGFNVGVFARFLVGIGLKVNHAYMPLLSYAIYTTLFIRVFKSHAIYF